MVGFVVQIVYELVSGNTVGEEFRRILIEGSTNVENVF